MRAARARLDLAAWSTRPEGGHEVWFSYTDHTTPTSVHRFDAPHRRRPRCGPRPPGARRRPARRARPADRGHQPPTARRSACSSSPARTRSTRTAARWPRADDPLRLRRLPDLARPRATPRATLAWVEAGGVYVVANLRGGGEEGEEWHRAGHARRTSRTCSTTSTRSASTSSRTGWTTPDAAGVLGRLQRRPARRRRPDPAARPVRRGRLLRPAARHGPLPAVRPRASTWTEEYGDADDPTELGWLLGYSPYHRVVDGTRLPGDPVHGLRGRHPGRPAARPQAAPRRCRRATSGDRPDPACAASAASATAAARCRAPIGLSVEQLQFVADRTGLRRGPRVIAATPGAEPVARRTRSPRHGHRRAPDTWWDWFVGLPLRIILIVVVSGIVLVLLRRSIRSITNHVADGTPFLDRGILKPIGPVRGRRRAGQGQPAGRAPAAPSAPARSARCCARSATIVVGGIAFFLVLGELGVNLAPFIASRRRRRRRARLRRAEPGQGLPHRPVHAPRGPVRRR